jgi:hypothetical protein
VKVIEADEQRISQRRLFKQRLDVLQQPEPLLRGRVQVTEGVARDEGVVAAEERIEEHVKPRRPAMRFSHSAPHPEGALGSH